MAERPTLYIVDGGYYIFRAFYAVRNMHNAEGLPTNGLFAFTNMLLSVLEKDKPTYLAVAFDPKGGSFRNEIYPEYKANRGDPPEELVPQFPFFRPLVRALNLPILEVSGYEADDVIGTVAKANSGRGFDVVILSGDKDLCQVVSDDVVLYDSMRERRVGMAEVEARFQVGPALVPDVLGLAGDTSDNIPGVPGIGEKTAGKLVREFGSLDGVLENAHTIKATKRRENLLAFGDQAQLSKKLATICLDVPIAFDLEAHRVSAPDFSNFDALCAKFEFRRFPQRLRALFTEAAETAVRERPADVDYKAILTREAFDACLAEVRETVAAGGWLSVDLETTSLAVHEAKIVGVALAWKSHQGVYIPVAHTGHRAPKQPSLIDSRQLPLLDLDPSPPPQAPKQLPRDHVLEKLRPLLEDRAVPKVGQHVRYEIAVFKRYGIRLRGIACDTMLAAYLLDSNRRSYSLDALASHYLSHTNITYADVAGTGKSQRRFGEVEVELATPYASEDADIALRLAKLFMPLLEEQNLRGLHDGLEIPVAYVLDRMEARGIQLDSAVLAGLATEFRAQLNALEEEACLAAGAPFLLTSPKQLAKVLFEELGLPVLKKKKTGPSTDQSVLERLLVETERQRVALNQGCEEQGSALAGEECASQLTDEDDGGDEHASQLTDEERASKLAALERSSKLVGLVLQHRQLAKLMSTYVEKLPKQVRASTNRVHAHFHQVGTATGRLSCSNPNLQNIPIRTEEGRRIRTAFVAPSGWLLVAADYSQVELRLLAHMSADPVLCDAFVRGEDIHTRTAAEVFKLPVQEVSKEQRSAAKAINFGLIYGMGAQRLAEGLGVGRREASAYIERYFDRLPGIKPFLEELKDKARNLGYAETLFGRRRPVPQLLSGRGQEVAFGERLAINTPIQGTAADLIKVAMVSIDGALREGDLPAHMLLQVHDELVFECEADRVLELENLVREHMSAACPPSGPLLVPLVVDVGIGANWAALK